LHLVPVAQGLGETCSSGQVSSAALRRAACDEVSFQQAWEMHGDALKVLLQNDADLQSARRAVIAKYVAYTKEVSLSLPTFKCPSEERAPFKPL
jgi:hypothetical protein